MAKRRGFHWGLLAWAVLTAPVWGQPVRPVVGKEETVVVSPGENLYQLGMRYSLAIEHFAFANHVPIRMDYPAGQKLLVPLARVLPNNPPSDGIVVNLPERGLFLFREGKFDKFFPIAIGQPGRFSTPMGSSEIVSRVKNPTWMPPEWAGLGPETVVPAGPANPLGDRWIGLSLPGVGFHSTNQPTSIGQAASHGCMRMYPDSVHDLFERVTVGMSVRIEYEPVKVGRGEDGSLYLTVFPDVYGRKPLFEETRRVLAQAGLGDWVIDSKLKSLIANPSGRPEVIADANVSVAVAGETLENPAIGLLTSGGLFIQAEALRRAGYQTQYDGDRKILSLKKDDQEVNCSMGSDAVDLEAEGGLAKGVLIDGVSYVSAREVLTRFNVPIQWDKANRRLDLP
jgi:L,D-transpeptidase ErfK/SrfK